MLVVKNVRVRKDGIKYVIIPKNSEVTEGKMVVISDNLDLIKLIMEEENGRE